MVLGGGLLSTLGGGLLLRRRFLRFLGDADGDPPAPFGRSFGRLHRDPRWLLGGLLWRLRL